jgi:hypothetical protein
MGAAEHLLLALEAMMRQNAAAEKGVSPARFLAKKNVSPRPSKPRWQWLCGAIASRNHRRSTFHSRPLGGCTPRPSV